MSKEVICSKNSCTSFLLPKYSKDPAMTLSLPMEHFTSNSGQMPKQHFSLPRTPQERQDTSCMVRDRRLGTQAVIYSTSVLVRWGIFCLETHFHTRFILYASSGNNSKHLDLKIPNIHCNWSHCTAGYALEEHLIYQTIPLCFSLREARLGHNQVKRGQSELRILFDHWYVGLVLRNWSIAYKVQREICLRATLSDYFLHS